MAVELVGVGEEKAFERGGLRAPGADQLGVGALGGKEAGAGVRPAACTAPAMSKML